MNTENKQIIVIEGTGYFGRKVVEKLENKEQPLKVVNKNLDTAQKNVGEKVEIYEGDVTNRDLCFYIYTIKHCWMWVCAGKFFWLPCTN